MSALRRLAAAAGVCGVVSSFGVAAANETGVPDLGASTGTLPLETAPYAEIVDSDVAYTERRVLFPHPDAGYRLAGTLTVPCGSGPFPGVVLVSGSGSQDRDETIGRVKPFGVLADGLARQGIVVLRFDDRGVGASGGDMVEVSGATTVDLATDALAAVEFLSAQPEVASGGVGVVGHSEGGLIAPIVANDAPDLVAFVVLLAGSAVPGAEILERQTIDILTAEGTPAEIVDWNVKWARPLIEIAMSDLPTPEAAAAIRDVADAAVASAPPGAFPGAAAAEVDATIAAFTDPWLRFFLAYDPAPVLADVDVPVLALFGDLDVQVAADVNGPAAEAALVNKPDASVVTINGLNHLFQPAITGAVSEYQTLGQPFPSETVVLIADWIRTYTEVSRSVSHSANAAGTCGP